MPDNPDISVRALTPKDKESWYPLWRGYQEFYRTDIPDAVTETTWQRLLDPAEPMDGAIARGKEGGALGLVHHIRHRSCWTTGDYCYLQDLFVDPARRGGGAGRTLVEHVYAVAEKQGCSRVYWLTHETNAQAMKLYDRIADRSGFVQYRHLF